MNKLAPSFASILLLFSCTASQPSEVASTDTLSTSVNSAPAVIAEAPVDRPEAVIDPALTNTDTLFNMLARLDAVHGSFVAAEKITENFIDAANPESKRVFIAFLIQSGEGEYGGMHSDVAFETIFSVLAIFEMADDELTYVTHAEVDVSSSGGLILSTAEAEQIKLAEEKYGVLVHSKSSEEGAGDSGFRRDDASLHVLMDGKIEVVFKETLDDFSFASNETDSYGEQTTTVELTVLDSKTNGLFDIQTVRTTSGNSWTEVEEEEPAADESDESAETSEAADSENEDAGNETEPSEESEADDGIDIYKFMGGVYEITNDN